MLETYVQMFAKLRNDRGRDRYPEITYHRAPHKPFLLTERPQAAEDQA